MKKIEVLFKNDIFFLIFGLLIVGALGSENFYVVVPQLQLFRVAFILSFLFMLIAIAKLKICFSNLSKFVLFFFLIQYVWTTEVSIYLTTLNLKNFFNFTILFLLILNLLFLMEYNKKLFIKTFLKVSILMFIISISISIWEIITHKHLSSSITNNSPEYLAFVPTAFYGNPNQLASILTLILLFLFAYFKTLKKEPSYWFYIIFLMSIIVTFFTQSVLNLILQLFILLLTVVKVKKIFKLLFLGLILLIAFYWLSLFISNKSFDFNYIINGYLAGGSYSIRKALYLDAINSIGTNFSFGYGVNNSSLYYQLLNDPKVKGIVNPHNYLLEMLINSGLYIIILYIILNIYLSVLFMRNKQLYLIIVLLLYHIILISGSSALFGWYYYIFFIAIISLYDIDKKQLLVEKK